jgi:hypothetical protein
MGTTTFTGPVKAGDVLNTTGSTVGTLRNVGTLVAAQSAAVVQSTTAAATGIVIPANSTIIGIELFVTTAWSSATTTYTISVGTSATATELVAATNANAVGILSLNPGTDATRTAAWVNTGTIDEEIWIDSGLPDTTPGAGRLVVTYIQAANA